MPWNIRGEFFLYPFFSYDTHTDVINDVLGFLSDKANRMPHTEYCRTWFHPGNGKTTRETFHISRTFLKQQNDVRFSSMFASHHNTVMKEVMKRCESSILDSWHAACPEPPPASFLNQQEAPW